MHNSCLFTPIYSFPSAASFESFDVDLTQKLANHNIKAVAPPTLKYVSAAFICTESQEIWVLSEPDNAWRGFFLPQVEAIRHLAAQTKATTNKQFGCLLIMAFVVLLIIWRNLL
jgi:hypothetical protein